MTVTTPTNAPRHRWSMVWLLALVAGVLVVGLVAAGLLLRSRVDVVPAPEGETTVEALPAARWVHAERMADAATELTALRAAARDVPAVDAASHDRMVLLRLVTTSQVPVEALGVTGG